MDNQAKNKKLDKQLKLGIWQLNKLKMKKLLISKFHNQHQLFKLKKKDYKLKEVGYQNNKLHSQLN